VADDQPIGKVLKQSEKIAQAEEELELEDEENMEKAKKERKRPKRDTKLKWSMEEENEIEERFSKHFARKERPSPAFCEKVINISRKNGGLLQHRKKDVLKKKVFRMIDRL